MKIPNNTRNDDASQISLARIVSEDSQRSSTSGVGGAKSSKDS